jgi:hypothetical protein
VSFKHDLKGSRENWIELHVSGGNFLLLLRKAFIKNSSHSKYKILKNLFDPDVALVRIIFHLET